MPVIWVFLSAPDMVNHPSGVDADQVWRPTTFVVQPVSMPSAISPCPTDPHND